MYILFEHEKTIENEEQKTVLLQAIENDIPLFHACGGRARCSTCRVIVVSGSVPERNEVEAKLAKKLGLPDNVRLSCQLKVSSDVHLRRVVRDEKDRKLLHQSNSAQEKNLAILFSDIRSFTTFSERHLPHDIVHILNRYFLEMGDAIHQHQGRIDKYMGDGIMAIFGLDGDEHPARQAYRAAKDMLIKLESFNTYLHETYGETFQIGVGIHYGSVVVGGLGHPDHNSFTAIGDTVNVAARIESATKGRGNILVSEAVYQVLDESGWQDIELQLKGKTESLKLFVSPE